MSAVKPTAFYGWLLRHRWAAFLLLGLSFVLFGAASLNLVQLFVANVNFLTMYGWDAVREGGLWQLVQLVVSAYVAVACYVLFKTCEHALVERISHAYTKENS